MSSRKYLSECDWPSAVHGHSLAAWQLRPAQRHGGVWYRHERLYDALWSRRNVASSDGSLRPARKTEEQKWKPATEINRLQRRLADQTGQLSVSTPAAACSAVWQPAVGRNGHGSWLASRQDRHMKLALPVCLPAALCVCMQPCACCGCTLGAVHVCLSRRHLCAASVCSLCARDLGPKGAGFRGYA